MDNTAALLDKWCSAAREIYLSVDCYSSEKRLYVVDHPYTMPNERYENVARLRQEALDTARDAKADYLLVSREN